MFSEFENIISTIELDFKGFFIFHFCIREGKDCWFENFCFGSKIGLNKLWFTSKASSLTRKWGALIKISYFYPEISPESLAISIKELFFVAEKIGFLTAFLIVSDWVWIALFKFSEAASKLWKMKTSSSAFRPAFFLSFCILFIISLAKPLILSSSFCRQSNKTLNNIIFTLLCPHQLFDSLEDYLSRIFLQLSISQLKPFLLQLWYVLKFELF